MKFSYDIIVQLVPDAPAIEGLAELIRTHLFEVESVEGDVLDIKILPNRYPDAACYWGLAREISAIMGDSFAMPKTKMPKASSKRSVTASIAIPHLCRRIMACPILGVKVGPSPTWLKTALEASGMRSINTVVDITNYVMMETGQPLHAFDLDKMEGNELIVRQAREGERIETLGGGSFELNPKVIVLSDASHALDIAGIKGGTRAELNSTTKNILLTAGTFDGALIYKTSRNLGLTTDASVRFSHTLHASLVERGLARGLELILELAGGSRGIISDAYPKEEKPTPVRFSAKRFAAVTGLELRESECHATLKRLGFAVKGPLVTPPLERKDIIIEEDVIEEIARMKGYASLPVVAPEITLASTHHDAGVVFEDRVRDALSRIGMTEIRTRSFTDAGEVPLENPLSSEQAFLRPSLVHGMRAVMKKALRFEGSTTVFELGRVFGKKATHEPYEEAKIGIACAGKGQEALREALGYAEALCDSLDAGACTVAEAGSGTLSLLIGDVPFGTASYGTNDCSWAVVELSRNELMRKAHDTATYAPVPKFPRIARDISCVVDTEARTGKLIAALKEAAGELLTHIEFTASYAGAHLGERKKSLTFRAIFGSDAKTLTDAEADDALRDMVRSAQAVFPFEVR